MQFDLDDLLDDPQTQVPAPKKKAAPKPVEDDFNWGEPKREQPKKSSNISFEGKRNEWDDLSDLDQSLGGGPQDRKRVENRSSTGS